MFNNEITSPLNYHLLAGNCGIHVACSALVVQHINLIGEIRGLEHLYRVFGGKTT